MICPTRVMLTGFMPLVAQAVAVFRLNTAVDCGQFINCHVQSKYKLKTLVVLHDGLMLRAKLHQEFTYFS